MSVTWRAIMWYKQVFAIQILLLQNISHILCDRRQYTAVCLKYDLTYSASSTWFLQLKNTGDDLNMTRHFVPGHVQDGSTVVWSRAKSSGPGSSVKLLILLCARFGGRTRGWYKPVTQDQNSWTGNDSGFWSDNKWLYSIKQGSPSYRKCTFQL